MPTNKMNNLLNKIERRLGTRQLNLPDYLQKDNWAKDVIANDTLDTFSRFFPNSMHITLDLSQRRKDGYYIIDKYVPENIEILGVRDIDWALFSRDSLRLQEAQGYGTYDFMTNNYGLDDIALLQMRADHMSMFNNQIFIDFKPPNMIKVSTVTGADITRGMKSYPIEILIKHAPNLMTIPSTMMEIFEELAEADVARFLYEELKYFDGLETVFANIDMKISDLESKASRREDIVQRLDEAHVSAANKNQPLMFTI
jgi:hypothetical protein